MIVNFIAVGCGGFFGAISRFSIGLFCSRFVSFPIATLIVNVLGSFLIGLLFYIYLGKESMLSKPMELFIFVGFLGGFTTFSTFSKETFDLLTQGATMVAMLNIVLNFSLCIGAVFLGHYLGGIIK